MLNFCIFIIIFVYKISKLEYGDFYAKISLFLDTTAKEPHNPMDITTELGCSVSSVAVFVKTVGEFIHVLGLSNQDTYSFSKCSCHKGLPYGFTKISFNFDGLYFWNHWEFGDILYLIWMVSSSFNRTKLRQHFYPPPHHIEKGHFTPEKGYRTLTYVHVCKWNRVKTLY